MAEKNRVYEIAKAHGLTSKELLAVLQELGVMAKSHMSVLSDEDLELVENKFSKAEAKGGIASKGQCIARELVEVCVWHMRADCRHTAVGE